jgi:hypothetical protein
LALINTSLRLPVNGLYYQGTQGFSSSNRPGAYSERIFRHHHITRLSRTTRLTSCKATLKALPVKSLWATPHNLARNYPNLRFAVLRYMFRRVLCTTCPNATSHPAASFEGRFYQPRLRCRQSRVSVSQLIANLISRTDACSVACGLGSPRMQLITLNLCSGPDGWKS